MAAAKGGRQRHAAAEVLCCDENWSAGYAERKEKRRNVPSLFSTLQATGESSSRTRAFILATNWLSEKKKKTETKNKPTRVNFTEIDLPVATGSAC